MGEPPVVTGQGGGNVGSGPEGGRVEYGRLYPVAKALLSPAFRLLWRLDVDGLENVPEHGPAIFCPNHVSFLDSFFLPIALPRRITFVGKAEYMDDWKTRYIFPAIGMIPLDRSGGSAAERALAAAARVLERGELFGIYPEGTRSRDGKLHRGHTGPARLALRTGAPIIPVGIIGTREIQPPGAKAPRPFRPVEVRFAPPVRPERYAGRSQDRLAPRQMIDDVMYEIRSMTGQEYVDEYATRPSRAAVGLPMAYHPAGEPAGGYAGRGEVAARAGGEAPTDGEAVAAAGGRSSAEALARWS